MLYNKEQKIRYIDETEANKVQYRQQMMAVFNNTSESETQLNKDISKFKLSEILNTYKSLKTSSLERLLVFDSQIKRYSNWCIKVGINKPEEYHFAEIDRELVETCLIKTDKIITRENLLKEISILPNVSDRFLILAIFEGICGKEYSELINLTMNDFEVTDGKYFVKLPTRKLEVSKELYELAEESSKTYELWYYTQDLSFMKNEFQKSDKIIKDLPQVYTSTDRAKSIRIRNRLERAGKYLGNDAIKRAALLESGRIDLIQRRRKEDDVTWKQVIKANEEEITERYGKIQAYSRYLQIYQPYLGD